MSEVHFGYINMFPHCGKQLNTLTRFLLKAFVLKVAYLVIFFFYEDEMRVSSPATAIRRVSHKLSDQDHLPEEAKS